jgi:hypothetical protein
MINPITTKSFLLTLLIGVSAHAYAAEHKVPCSTLPSAVQEKSKAVLDGATVQGCVKDVSGGKTTYEMETLKDGRGKDITFDASGAVLEVEEQVDESSLPAPVAASLRKAYSGGKLGKIESLTRGGVLVSYEAVVIRNGKSKEVAFRPDGSAMKAD